MTRSLALTLSFFLAGGGLALAQAHPQTHPPGRPHGPGHVRPDSVTHDAMHGLLVGNWHGTSNSPGHESGKLDLAVVSDKLGNVTLKMNAAHPLRIGPAST